MIQLKNFFCIIVVITVTVLSCSKKSNSRNGEEDTPSTVTTTHGTPSTTGGTTGTTSSGQATGTIVGVPSCTLNPMQVLCSNFLSNMTLDGAGSFQQTSLYDMYNYNSQHFVHLYFKSTMAPATGGYSVVPVNPSSGFLGSDQVSVMFEPNSSAGGYNGYVQNGVVYVTNTGTLVSAVFCNLLVNFQSGASTYSAIVSARIEK